MARRMPDLSWLTKTPYAHRGLHDEKAGIAENSLSAIGAAITAGYGIEIDVQPAADHTPMVFHDDTLNRMTDARGPVSDHGPEALRNIHLSGTVETIPTLADALDHIAGRTPVLVEIKHKGHSDGTFERAILDTVEGYDGPVALMSFEPSALSNLRAMAPETPRGLVSEAYWLKPFWPHVRPLERLRRRLMLHAIRTAPHFIAYHWRDLRNPFLRLAMRLNRKPLLSWTVRTPQEAEMARERHADQIIFEHFHPGPGETEQTR